VICDVSVELSWLLVLVLSLHKLLVMVLLVCKDKRRRMNLAKYPAAAVA
jgi:hypothetical protein